MSEIHIVMFVSLAKMRKEILLWLLISKSELKVFTTQNFRLKRYMRWNYTLLSMQKAVGNYMRQLVRLKHSRTPL